MRIEIQIDPNCDEPKLLILTDQVTDEINELVQRLSVDVPQILIGFRGDQAEPVPSEDIVRVYASSGKVYAVTEQKEFVLRLRLYEAEKRLDKKFFVRISQSELINLRKVRRFDLSFAGTIGVQMSDGTTSYVSRRYVSKIKKRLEM